MFENLDPLDVAVHKDIRLQRIDGLAYARNVPSAPLSATEIGAAARHFPIVFPDAEPFLPVALMSLKPGENAFIGPDGEWLADYVPAHIRRYPFILGSTGDTDRFAIMIARDAPHISLDHGERLYDDDGEMTDVLTKAMEFLKTFHQETVATSEMIKPLIDKNMLIEKTYTVTREDGKQASYNGLRVVDAERIQTLDDATLAAWVRSGLMGLIYAHLNSIDNIRRLANLQQVVGTNE